MPKSQQKYTKKMENIETKNEKNTKNRKIYKKNVEDNRELPNGMKITNKRKQKLKSNKTQNNT